jgi:hypothetical protein
METHGRERRHDLSPAVRKFREAMQKQDARSMRRLEARFKHMH